MDVQDAVPGDRQDGRRDDLAVVGKHAQVRPEPGDGGERLRRPDSEGLEPLQVQLQRTTSDRDGGHLPSPPTRAVRGADDAHELETRQSRERVEDRDRKRARTEEQGSDRLAPRVAPGGQANAGACSPAPAGSVSSSSAEPVPTAISSSIESR